MRLRPSQPELSLVMRKLRATFGSEFGMQDSFPLRSAWNYGDKSLSFNCRDIDLVVRNSGKDIIDKTYKLAGGTCGNLCLKAAPLC